MRTAAVAGFALTVVAVGAGGASAARAVAAAPMTTRVAATPAVPASTPVAGGAASALLINGDDVQITGRDVSVRQGAGMGGAGSVFSLDLAGQRYVLPMEALPYLGRGLDPDLFDVAALAKEAGDELRVTVTYTGGVPSLPGVTITKAARGVAQGYLTAPSAEVFGAALARQFDEDHANASYGTDGLFGNGVTIGLAGNGLSGIRLSGNRLSGDSLPAGGLSRSGAIRPDYEMHTLTVDGTNLAGKPDTGDVVVLVNVNDPLAFSGPDEWINDFYDGTTKFSVPAGTYWAIGLFGEYGIIGTTLPGSAGASAANTAIPPLRAVVLPQVTVLGNTTVKMAERSADSEFAVTTPRPSQLEVPTLSFNRVAANHSETSIVISPNGAIYVNPTSHAPRDGTLSETAQAQLVSPPSAASPYQYDVWCQGPAGIIPRQDFTISPASLATVAENLYSDTPTTGSFNEANLLDGFSSEIVNFMPVPGQETMYLTASAGGVPIVWNGHFFQARVPFTVAGHQRLFPVGGQDGMNVYRPGQVATEGWNEYPLHVAQRANLVGAGGSTNLAASRAGNTLTFVYWPFSDDTPGHAGSAGAPPGSGITTSGTYQIQQDGKTISAGQTGVDLFFQQVTLSSKPSEIKLTLNSAQSGGPFTESTADSTTWTWQSSYAPKHLLPPGFACGTGNQNCVSQPMLTLNYGVAGEALNGTTQAGPQQVTINAGHLQLAVNPKITCVTAQVSFNDGKTWTAAQVTGTGDTFTADFTAPASSYITLRVQAADAAGGTMQETITRAYATAADPVTDGYRTCAQPAAPDEARCFVIWPSRRAAGTAQAAQAGSVPPGWGAKQIEAAYKLPVARNPHQTVAVVEAFDNTDLASYLATYRKQFGLPACDRADGCLRVVNQNGKAAPLPKSGLGTGWDVESTLDVDMVSAACPHCRILVVDASGTDLSDFAAADDTAARLGASVISNSWGVREDGYAMTFAKAFDHPGHVIVASSGDTGFDAANFPASLAMVTAVGGTELARAHSKRGWTEQVWDTGGASGSACSAYEPKPRWQHDPHCQMRTVADVSAVAWNVAIYDGYLGGWLDVGGTSAAAPLIAGVYALAGNAARVPPGYEYAHTRSLYNVTVGSNDHDGGATCGHDYLCQAQKGYNAPTGLGTPDGTGAL
jgi:Subtilase family